MSDRQPGDLPEREEQVRRLLADARHAEPMPDAVAQRLDLVLAQLVAEGPGGLEEVAPVVDLAARRRRRVGALLVAAAAVVVAGVGVGALTRDSGSDSAPTSAGSVESKADQADTNVSEEAGSADGSTGEQGAGPAAPTTSASLAADPPESTVGPQQEPGSARASAPVRLSRDGFADEVAGVQGRSGYATQIGTTVPGSDLSMAEAFVCPPADWGTGTLFAALYDGVPAVLAFRPPTDATQTVELLRCASGDLLRTTTLPAP